MLKILRIAVKHRQTLHCFDSLLTMTTCIANNFFYLHFFLYRILCTSLDTDSLKVVEGDINIRYSLMMGILVRDFFRSYPEIQSALHFHSFINIQRIYDYVSMHLSKTSLHHKTIFFFIFIKNTKATMRNSCQTRIIIIV